MTDAPHLPPAALPADDAGQTALILDVIAQETGIARERLLPATTLAELEIPSLDMVQAVFALETRFNVEIPVVADRAGAEFETVDDLVRHVLAAIADQGAA